MQTKQVAPIDPSLEALSRLHEAEQVAAKTWEDTHVNDTMRQIVVLDAVQRCATPPSQTDIVQMTRIDRSTLADIVRRLVEKGHLTRRRTREDARAYALRLTDTGAEALAAGRAAARSTVAELRSRIVGLDGLRVLDPAPATAAAE